MILSDEGRSLRKQQQLDRLAAKKAAAEANKGKSADDSEYSGYHSFYSGQGLQVAKAEHNAKITNARQLVRSTRDQLDLAKINGVGIAEAMAAHNAAVNAVTVLENEKQAMFGRPTSAGLAGASA